VAAIAAELGTPLMPWQRQVVDVALEVDESGRPYWREVVALLPRQHGKSVLTLAFMLQRALCWSSSQRIAYTAQTGNDARRKLLEDFAPMLQASRFDQVIAKIKGRAGNEGISFRTGSQIDVIASSERAGHGRTLDLAIFDEIFADQDSRREQAMLPAMATRPHAQLFMVSTAGTDESVFLQRKVEAGRASVIDGARSGIAYFEWSAPEDASPDDEAAWWACMPALGHTIDLEVVRHARRTMSEGDFRRAYLNQWTIADERVIPAGMWDPVCSDVVAPEGRLVFGLDVAADRSGASIVAADNEGRCELVDTREGVAWVVDRAVELARKWDAPLVVDVAGPASTFIDAITSAGVEVERYQSRQVAMACAALFDAVADRTIQVRTNERMDAAVAGARRRVSGDSWYWGRRDTTVDVSPLVALTLAFDAAQRAATRNVVPQVFFFGGDDG
jgi:hypothetical protein